MTLWTTLLDSRIRSDPTLRLSVTAMQLDFLTSSYLMPRGLFIIIGQWSCDLPAIVDRWFNNLAKSSCAYAYKSDNRMLILCELCQQAKKCINWRPRQRLQIDFHVSRIFFIFNYLKCKKSCEVPSDFIWTKNMCISTQGDLSELSAKAVCPTDLRARARIEGRWEF